MTASPRLLRPASLKEDAYRQIKEVLLAGQLEPGRFYSAQFFADRLEMSRTPVREALLQLANEGLLVCLDVRGFRLRAFSPRDIRDIFETRLVIEVHVLKGVQGKLALDDLAAMEACQNVMRGCAKRGDAEKFLDADREFHMIPVRRAGNSRFVAILNELRDHICLLGQQALQHEGRFAEIDREHAAILKALKRKDSDAACTALAAHLSRTESYLQPPGA